MAYCSTKIPGKKCKHRGKLLCLIFGNGTFVYMHNTRTTAGKPNTFYSMFMSMTDLLFATNLSYNNEYAFMELTDNPIDAAACCK